MRIPRWEAEFALEKGHLVSVRTQYTRHRDAMRPKFLDEENLASVREERR